MTLLPTALEEAAKAVEAAELAWKAANGGDKASCIDCPDVDKATAAITAYLARAEKEGWVMVPIEPTQVMLDAATSTTSGYSGPDHDYDDDVRDHYRAMLAAAQNGGE